MRFDKEKFLRFIFSDKAAAVWLLIGLAFLFGRTCVAPDGDIFFLITTGRDIIERGGITHELLHTVHEGFHTIIQQYASTFILAFLYEHGDFHAIMSFFLILGLISLFLAGLYIMRHLSSFPLRVLAFVHFTWMVYPVFYPRPWAFTAISMLAVLTITDIYFRQKGSRLRFLVLLLPVISILQINIHASMWYIVMFMAFISIIPPFDASFSLQTVKTWLRTEKLLIRAVMLMVPCCLITPYGIESVLYLPLSYGQATMQDTISELHMPPFLSSFGVYICICCILVYLYVRMVQVIDGAVLLAVTGIFLAGLHKRDMFILSIFILPCMCRCLSVFEKDARIYGSSFIGRHFVTCMLFLCYISISFTKCIYLVNSDTLFYDCTYYPKAAADALDEIGAQGSRVYTTFSSGAYMEFRGYTVYIDARPELFQKQINKKKDVYSEYMDIHLGNEFDYDAFLSQYDFDYYLVPSDDLMFAYMCYSDRYDAVCGGNGYILFGNDD